MSRTLQAPSNVCKSSSRLHHDVQRVLDDYAHKQAPQLITCPYYDGQRGQHNTVVVQSLFLQNPLQGAALLTEEMFRQRVDWCFRTARRSHVGVTLMTENDARVLITVPP